ncbi:MAG: mechanosensitive ion channel domain-containing protein [Rhizobiaceae bacterium]
MSCLITICSHIAVYLLLSTTVQSQQTDQTGTLSGAVEKIGPRSTQVCARDRTIITIPNAAFSDMKIVNWARCDRMLIMTLLQLRYETKLD